MLAKPPEIIYTERLFLRKPELEDALSIFNQYAQDVDVTRYLTWAPHKSISDTKAFLKRCINVWHEGTAFPWTIIRNSDKQLLGMIEIVRIDHSGINLGYVLAKQFWGKGYMTESLKKIINWAFEQDDVFRVWAICDVENLASSRVMEKSGMQQEGVLRRWLKLSYFGDIPRDCYCYSIVK